MHNFFGIVAFMVDHISDTVFTEKKIYTPKPLLFNVHVPSRLYLEQHGEEWGELITTQTLIDAKPWWVVTPKNE